MMVMARPDWSPATRARSGLSAVALSVRPKCVNRIVRASARNTASASPLGARIPVTLEPYLGLAALRVHTGTFTEAGGNGAALAGLARDHDLGTATMGLRAEMRLGEEGRFVLRSGLGYRAAFGDIDPKALLAFAASPATFFQSSAVPLDRHAVVAETSLDWAAMTGVTLGLVSNGAYGRNAVDHGLKRRIEVRF